MTTFHIEEYLNSLPANVEIIDVSNKQITYIPSLERFKNLKKLICFGTRITTLPELPKTLEELNCFFCGGITEFPELPKTLKKLNCNWTKLRKQPTLPNGLEFLDFSNTKIKSIELPNTIKILYCVDNKMQNLPKLPNGLEILNCSYNNLTILPRLPDTLRELYCDGNKDLTYFPQIPIFLEKLTVEETQLPKIPIEIWKQKVEYHNELMYSPELPFYKQQWKILK
jgi:Leucine-rich repeat (LRR) protein